MNRALLGIALAVPVAATASAATLRTPVLGTVNLTDHVVCNILNVGKKPLEVSSIDLRDPVAGTSLMSKAAVVPSNQRDRVITVVGGVSPATNFYCQFEFKGGKKNARANISIGDNHTDIDSADAW